MYQFASKAIIPRTMAKFSQLIHRTCMAIVLSCGHNRYWARNWKLLLKKSCLVTHHVSLFHGFVELLRISLQFPPCTQPGWLRWITSVHPSKYSPWVLQSDHSRTSPEFEFLEGRRLSSLVGARNQNPTIMTRMRHREYANETWHLYIELP